MARILSKASTRAHRRLSLAAFTMTAVTAVMPIGAFAYTGAQADQGHQLFNDNCAECHRPDLTGALGPALKGDAFLSKWGGQSVEDFYQFEHANMPANAPGSMANDQMLAITSYILQKNGVKPDDKALSEADAKTQNMPKAAH